MNRTAIMLTCLLALLWLTTLGRAWHAPLPLDTVQPAKPTYRIDINHADHATLQLLPGVGPGIAHHVIDYREQGGYLAGPSDLPRVHRIGPRTAEQIAPWVRYGDRAVGDVEE